jgi:hypothetical protein
MYFFAPAVGGRFEGRGSWWSSKKRQYQIEQPLAEPIDLQVTTVTVRYSPRRINDVKERNARSRGPF